ncbi:MAG TPA: SIMPL domain-containing protein [Pirellulales bacterium]|nr:SIMPL domain-containing protein [Pirellulales bacterium]
MSRIVRTLAGCCLAVTLASFSAADDGGITVVGVGEARGKPDALEFRAHLAGSAELANDALTKFQEYKRRALSAVEQLQLKEIKVSVGAMSLLQTGNQNQMYVMNGFMPANEAVPKAEVALSSLLRVTLHDIDKMTEETVFELATQLVDKLKDAGVSIHATQMGVNYADPEADESYAFPLLALFVLDDGTALRELARRRAFQAARASAANLAELAELRLGPVEAMHETASETETVADAWQDVDLDDPAGIPATSQPSGPRLTSRTFTEIPVRVSLQVRFRTRPKADDARPSGARPSGKEE